MNTSTDSLPVLSDAVQELTNRLKNRYTERDFKRLRTRRRRIRSYFGGVANINSIDFTIGSEVTSKTVIGGYFLKINARISLKALNPASEGYCLDTSSAHILSPIFYALASLYCLHLSHLTTTLYITSSDALKMCEQLKTTEAPEHDAIAKGVRQLLLHLSKVNLIPCVKGPLFEKMNNKLYQIQQGTNELVTLDFQAIAEHLLQIP